MSINHQIRDSFQILIVISLLLLIFIFTGCAENNDIASEDLSMVVPSAPTADATVATTVTETPTGVEEMAALPSSSTGVDSAVSDSSYPAPRSAEDIDTPAANLSDYPAPEAVTASPLALDSYPAPVQPTPETSRIPIVPFVLERPLKPGDTIVRGTGPANVPIIIANVFLMGEVIGEGIIDADGHFEIAVPPLEEGHWIGIALDNLSGTEYTYEDFYARGFRGEGAEQVPQVGFVYDSDFVR
jgi:hypothetical protein